MLVIVVQWWPAGSCSTQGTRSLGRLRPFPDVTARSLNGIPPATYRCSVRLSSAVGHERILFIGLVGRLKLLTTEFRRVLGTKCYPSISYLILDDLSREASRNSAYCLHLSDKDTEARNGYIFLHHTSRSEIKLCT